VLDATVVNVALPSIKHDLGFSQSNLAWVVDAYLLVAGGFLLLGGRMADLFGRRRTFLAGAVAFAVGSLASGLAQDQGTLIAARAFQGLGEAFAGPAALSIIAVLFVDSEEKTKALSVWAGLAALAGVLGVILSGVIVDLVSWRWIFWINLPVAAAVLVATPRLVRGDVRRGGRAFDVAGAVTMTAGVTVAVYGLLEANRDGWSSTATRGLLLAAAALLSAFVGIERRRHAPLVPLGFVTGRRPSTASGLMMLFVSALYSMFFLLTLYMQLVLGWSPLHTGLAYLPFGLSMLIGVAASSQLVPRIGVRPVAVASMTIAASGFWLLARIPLHGDYTGRLLPGLVLTALGSGLAYVAVTVFAVSDTRPEEAGLASGMITSAQQVGGALGLAAIVSVAATRTMGLARAGHPLGEAQVAGTHLAFVIATVLLAVGALLSAAMIGRFRPTTAMPLPEAPLQHVQPARLPRPRPGRPRPDRSALPNRSSSGHPGRTGEHPDAPDPDDREHRRPPAHRPARAAAKLPERYAPWAAIGCRRPAKGSNRPA
jgi:EmrB/QacA subfamily drug resistance transporter